MNSIPLHSPELNSRLVPLFNGRPGIRGGIHVEVTKAPSGPVLDFVSSDETLDRYDEVISASGWRLANYQQNPVFQNSHQYGDILFTLGKALTTEVRNGQLLQRIEFATDINPMARIAYGLYQGKFLNAVSVGFVPIRWENGGAKDSFRRKYLEQELLEVSAVAIPANPNALALGLKAGAVQRADLREAGDLLRLALEPFVATGPRPSACGISAPSSSPSEQFCSTPAGSNTDTRALGLRAFEAQLLQLARALKEALRR